MTKTERWEQFLKNATREDGDFKIPIHSQICHFYIPTGKKKSDIKKAKQGDVSEKANLFLHFARACGFQADFGPINENGCFVSVSLTT